MKYIIMGLLTFIATSAFIDKQIYGETLLKQFVCFLFGFLGVAVYWFVLSLFL